MMKKLVALLMALALLCTSIGVFAEEEIVVVPEEAEVVETETAETEEEKHVCDQTVKDETDKHYACEKDKVKTVPATCTEGAYTEYKCQAPNCGQTFKVYDAEHPALEHDPDWDHVEIKIQATCEHEGERFVPCKRKGCEGETQTTKKLDHTWVAGEPVKETCTTEGYTPNECSVCHATDKFDKVAATGHHLKVNPDKVPEGTTPAPESLYVKDDEALAKLEKDKLAAYYIWTLKEDQTCGQNGSLLEFAVCEDCGKKVVFTEKTGDMTKLTDHQEVLDEYVEGEEDETDKEYADRIIEKALDDAEKDEKDGKLYIPGVEFDNGTEYPGKYGKVEVTYTPATCLEAGSLVLKCTTCDAEVKIVEPALGHYYESNVAGSAKDCTADSWYMITCTRKGCDFQEQVKVEGRGYHVPDEDGVVKYTQKKFIAAQSLNKEVETETKKLVACLPYTEHIPCEGYTQVVTLSNGQEVEIPVACEKTIDNERKATADHVAGEGCIDIDSTCEKEGLKFFYCEDCGYSDGGVVEKKDHNQDKVVVKTAVGCENDGVFEYYCTGCKKLQATKTIPATGHDFHEVESATKPATCTEPGVKYEICSYCNAKKPTEIPPHHNAPADEVIKTNMKSDSRWAFQAANCTNPGSKTYECQSCHHFVTETIAPLGHDYERKDYKRAIVYEKVYYDKHVDATCERNEYYGRYCESCKNTKTGKYVAFEEVEIPDTKLDHKITELYLDTNNLPTCTSTGRGVYKCATCDYYDANFVLPKLPHNVTVAWNAKAGTYKITCDKAEWSKWDTLMKDYLKDEFANQGLTKAEAEEYRAKVLADLKNKLVTKDSKYIPGIDCDMNDVVEIGKPHYSVAMKDGIITLTPDPDCMELDNPVVVVNWSFTLSDGNSFGVTVPFIAYDAETLSYDVSSVKTPYGAKLNCVTVFVSDVVTSDITKVGPKGYGVAQF